MTRPVPPAPTGVMAPGLYPADVDEIQAMLAELEALTAQLPEEDGRLMETRRHHCQMDLLIHSLHHAWRDRQDFWVGGNQFVYYSEEQARAVIREVKAERGEAPPPPKGFRAYRGPDFFVVRGVDGSYSRQKWVVWQEGGRYPDLIVELLSPSTRSKDLGEKKRLYEQVFRTSEYFVWDPFDPGQFQGWRLHDGHYEPIEPNGRGWRWSAVLEMWLGPWEGVYDRERAVWLRFYDAEGNLVLTGEEAAEQRAEAAEQRAEAERRRAEAAEAELERAAGQDDLGEPG